MAWLAHRQLVHPLSASGFVCTQEESVGQGVKGGLGCKPTPECDTATRLLAPTHFAKVDQGILPVADYLHINLADVLGIRGVNNAKSVGARHREKNGGNNCHTSVVLIG